MSLSLAGKKMPLKLSEKGQTRQIGARGIPRQQDVGAFSLLVS